MKINKSGISLIVLVITIIVMIILGTVTILSISSTGIIDNANEAVESTNLKQVQDIANMAWMESYLKDEKSQAELEAAVIKALYEDNKIPEGKYDVDVTENGVTVTLKGDSDNTNDDTNDDTNDNTNDDTNDESNTPSGDYVTNKANGMLIEGVMASQYQVIEHKYELAAGATLSSITITDTSDFIGGVLNASNNWEIEGGDDTKIWFGTNSLGTTEGTLALGLAYFITGVYEGTITVQFTFADGKVETDTFEYAFKNNGEAV